VFDRRGVEPDDVHHRAATIAGDLLTSGVSRSVLSTVLSATDFGYCVILVEDALCSSSDESHDAALGLSLSSAV
jgi:hypothetical protein